MYIKKVTLKNLCCFEHLELTFETKKMPLLWTLVLGDNGVGKTTLLRSIALALCDETSASALYRELYGDLIRVGAGENAKAIIEVKLVSSAEPREEYKVTTTIQRLKESGEVKLTQRTDPPSEKFPWDKIFVCGYGAGRRAFGSKVLSEYSVTDAVEPLFNYESQLQNQELMLRRIKDDERTDIGDLLDRMCAIIGLESGSIRLKFGGPEVKGEWGTFLAIGNMPDGYAATLAWISDMLGWILYFDPALLRDPEGIVLLDEIEQHLHPRLQKEIIGRLKRQFPKLQFIVTTHSPLCAVGTTELTDEECKLALLSWVENSVEKHESAPPRGKRADQVLTSYLFGLATSGDRETREQIEKYSALLSKKDRDDKEEKQLKHLRSVLDQKLGSAESEFEQRVREAVSQVLMSESGPLRDKAKAVDYEIMRQLKELLE